MIVLSDISYSELETLLNRAPVLGEIHPLVPVCLSSNVRVIHRPETFLEELDDAYEVSAFPALIIGDAPELVNRFPRARSLAHPPVDVINKGMKSNIGYIRNCSPYC